MKKATDEVWGVANPGPPTIHRRRVLRSPRIVDSLAATREALHGWLGPMVHESLDSPIERMAGRSAEREFGGFIPMDAESLQQNPVEEINLKLERVTDHFRRRTGAVLSNDPALRLLADLYEVGAMEKSDLGLCQRCGPLAKLTAANLCEVGVNIIYITPAGRQLINSIENA